MSPRNYFTPHPHLRHENLVFPGAPVESQDTQSVALAMTPQPHRTSPREENVAPRTGVTDGDVAVVVGQADQPVRGRRRIGQVFEVRALQKPELFLDRWVGVVYGVEFVFALGRRKGEEDADAAGTGGGAAAVHLGEVGVGYDGAEEFGDAVETLYGFGRKPDLKTRYGGSNGPRIHQLKSEFQSLRQKGQTVVVYYNQFVTLWNKLYGSVDPTCGCRCEAAALIRAREEQEKTHHFLLGLDDEQFGHIRSQIIATEPVLDIHRAYALIVQEERHKSIVCGRDDRTDALAFAMQRPAHTMGRGDPPNYSCTHCGKDGHSVDRCYQLHGYPPGKGRGGCGTTSGRGGRGRGRTPSGGSSAPGRGTGRGVGSAIGGANAATNSNALGLTPDQMTRLLSMLDVSSSDKDTGSNGEASAREWLIDSGASHHMTGLCHEDGDWTG
ncbi:unnamed protein product [Cuscuta campestris]|uniref:Uncharacterized protein n=1 Tax=Cuscuta campestris TaxID=132261 RepID=A0A484NQN2_9ASTE|nr:unnamed protein product [Cuscuta campestris]